MENNEQNPESIEITELLVEEAPVATSEEVLSGEPVLEETVVAKTSKKMFQVKINIKAVVIGLIVLAVLALAYFYKGLIVAATVNNMPVSRMAVISELERTSGKEALDSIIRERLINMEAAKQNVSVSKKEIDAEFARIEGNLDEQGMTLDEALEAQKLTRADITEKIVTQKKLEKLLGDKTNVTDEEVEAYIKDNGVTLEKGKEAESKASIKENLKAQKFNTEANTFVEDLVTKANIKYWVGY